MPKQNIGIKTRLTGLTSVCGHTLVVRCIGPAPTVLDLGANLGQFSQWCARSWNARCVMVEASPKLAAELPDLPGCTRVHAAVTGKQGTIDLNLSDEIEASSIQNVSVGKTIGAVTVPATTIPALFEAHKLDEVSIVKVDIEGAEVEAFAATDDDCLRRCGQVSVEFHDFCGQITADDVLAIIDRFRGLGFYPVCFQRGHWDVLFVNAKKYNLGPMRQWYYGKLMRNVRIAYQLAANTLTGRSNKWV